MNIYSLVIETAQALRAAEPAQSTKPVKSGYAVANGAGIELLSQAIEYGIEGESLDARIEQWRADAPAESNEQALVESVEAALATLRQPKEVQVKPTWAPKTSAKKLGSWKKPTAMRIARAQSWVMAKNGELEGKAEYLSRLSQYDVHPDFGPWINDWLEQHQPINRKGLAPGVAFAKDPQAAVGYITQPEQPWKIPAAQVVEHWASDARLIEFQPCKDKKRFASHVREFWSQVDTAQAEGQKLLVLLPAAVYSYRFGGKGKRKA